MAKSFRVWLYSTALGEERMLFDEGISNTRIDLNVPFMQKDQAKAAGARWDNGKRVWYIPPGVETNNFKQWMVTQTQVSQPQAPQVPKQQPNVIAKRVDLSVPFAQKDQAKQAGARWDGGMRTWYAPPGTPIEGIAQWMPKEQAASSSTAVQNPYDPRAANTGKPNAPVGEYVCGVVKVQVNNDFGFNRGDKVVYSPIDDREWLDYHGHDSNEDWWEVIGNDRKKHVISANELADLVDAARDVNKKPMRVFNPDEYLDHLGQVKGTATTPGQQKVKGQRPTPEQVKIPAHHMTKYNTAIQEQFLNGIDSVTGKPANIVINALAGTGKTTMLKHLSSFIKPGEKWLYLVFNKKNQTESETKFPAGVDVLTTHAYLGRVLKQNGKMVGGTTELPPRDSKINRLKEILDILLPPDWPKTNLAYRDRKKNIYRSPFHGKAKWAVGEVANKVKAYALRPDDPEFQNKVMEMINRLKIDMDVSTEKTPQDRDYTPDIMEKVLEVVKMTLPGQLPRTPEYANLANMRDGDDTLWYAALYADQIRWNVSPHYDVILLDEVQDFNECQSIMTHKLQETGAKVIAVGDPRQSMYLFRGADANAFKKLQPMLSPGAPEMPLPINFRSDGNLIEFYKNNTEAKDLEGDPKKAGKGEVRTDAKYKDFMDIIQKEYFDGNRAMKHGTAVISRTNAPLTEVALTLLKNDVDFEIVGADLFNEIEGWVKKAIGAYGDPKDKMSAIPIRDFQWQLQNYVDTLQEKWGHKISKADELKALVKYAEALGSILHYLEDATTNIPTGQMCV